MSEVDEAAELYREFREDEPRRARRARINVPRAAAVIGTAEFVGYTTTHRGKVTLYIHEFAPGSRPALAAGKGLGELFFVGGRFKVTELGITDLDAEGRIVHARRRYEVALKPKRGA
jgi:hypothetical protein